MAVEGASQAPHPHPNPSSSKGREAPSGEALGVFSPSPSTGEGREGGETSSRTQRVRTLRQNMTDAERRLWQRLRRRQLDGYKFRRQFPLGPFIVDFVCLEARLVIEVDGGQHQGNADDKVRDTWLVGEGYRVLRLWNHEVLGETEVVLERIWDTLHPHPHPPPSRGRDGLPHAKQCPAPSPSRGKGGDGGEVGYADCHNQGQHHEH
jgi:very-short-patch-repair endonuclease